MSTPDYDTDSVKHLIRRKSWLTPIEKIQRKAERDFSKDRRNERFKYFTFCAKNALDVFMLEKEGLLYRDPETKRLVNVFFCEEKDEDFVIIEKLIGSSETVQGFYGNFTDLISKDFDDVESINIEEGDSLFDEDEDEETRRLRRLKTSQEDLYNSFPFDVINFDVYGNFFPEGDNRYSEQIKVLSKLFDLQKNNKGYLINEFLLILTIYTPVQDGQINQDVITLFHQYLHSNFAHQQIKDSFVESYKVESPENLNYHVKFTLGFLKSFLLREAYSKGWETELVNLYCYDRSFKNGEPYKMSSFVVKFSRNNNLDEIYDFKGAIPEVIEEKYINEVLKFISQFPQDIDANKISKQIIEDLKSVVEFREEYLRSINN